MCAVGVNAYGVCFLFLFLSLSLSLFSFLDYTLTPIFVIIFIYATKTVLFFCTLLQERRAREKTIEAAKKAVQAAAAEKRKPDPEMVALAEQTIEKDETEEGQATQDCEVGGVCVLTRFSRDVGKVFLVGWWGF